MKDKVINNRRKTANIEKLETAQAGFANGISLQLKDLINKGQHRSLNDKEKLKIIANAEKAYGKFLDALGVDWKNDPNSMETPRRVSKAYVNDLWKGRYEIPTEITAFPSDGYNGIVLERDIPVTSMCSHHHQAILGNVHIAYIPGPEGKVIGLSKLNRIVDWFARRPQMQESLTQQIHDFLSNKMECGSVAVSISSKHMCCSNRGVRNPTSTMTTNKFSGVFMEKDNLIREEFLHAISKNGVKF